LLVDIFLLQFLISFSLNLLLLLFIPFFLAIFLIHISYFHIKESFHYNFQLLIYLLLNLEILKSLNCLLWFRYSYFHIKESFHYILQLLIYLLMNLEILKSLNCLLFLVIWLLEFLRKLIIKFSLLFNQISNYSLLFLIH